MLNIHNVFEFIISFVKEHPVISVIFGPGLIVGLWCIIWGIIKGVLRSVGNLLPWEISLFPSKEEKIAIKKEKAGEDFEKKVAHEFGKLDDSPIQNVVLNYMQSNMAEIDMVWPTKKGVFVIECKHKNDKNALSGIADENSWHWGEEIIGNPILQNEVHIKRLKEILSPHLKYYNVVVSNAEIYTMFFNKRYSSSDKKSMFIPFPGGQITPTFIIQDHLIAHFGFKSLYKKLPDVYTDTEVKQLYKVLKEHTLSKEEWIEFKRSKGSVLYKKLIKKREKK